MFKAKKRAIICIYKGVIIDSDMAILENLDSKEFEVHLFNDVDENNLNFDLLPHIIKDIYGIKSNEYEIYVSSNIKEFIMLEYTLYKNLISGALYINNKPQHMRLDEFYRRILNNEMSQHTNISNFYLLEEEVNIFNDYRIFDGDFNNDLDNNDFVNKIYGYKEINHVFSIKDHDGSINANIINLDDSKIAKEYKYHFDIEYLEKYIEELEPYSNSINHFLIYNQIFLSKLEKNKIKILNLPNFEKDIVKFRLENELFNKGNKDGYKIFLSSILLNIFDESKYLEYLLNVLIESKSIDRYNMFFAYYQCVRYRFVSKNVKDENIDIIIESLYEKIYEEFSYISEGYSKIPKEQRDYNTVFVVTSQFLSVNHSPTKIALDVCYNLMKNLNKKVVLINTKEVLTSKGLMQMANITCASVFDYLNNVDGIEYKDIRIPFYQAEVNMPNEHEIINILNMLKKYKPSMIINVGTVLIGDLCSKIIPTVTIPLGVNGHSKSTFYVINTEEDYKNYSSKHNRNKESFIITKKSAFELKPQKHIFSKEELGIPQNKFILAVIGNRLNREIDEEFLEVLEESCKLNNSYVLFIDNFNFNESQGVKYKNLISNYKNMGYQEDLLATLENIDIYVNPKRKGGGTSAIYPMYLGKPVVTLNYGDVASITGTEFWVQDYKMMIDKINKYYTDTEFYNQKSNIAQKRAVELTDVSRYVKTIYEKTKNSILY